MVEVWTVSFRPIMRTFGIHSVETALRDDTTRSKVQQTPKLPTHGTAMRNFQITAAVEIRI